MGNNKELKGNKEERKYGLVWENHVEKVEKELKYKTPILEEEESLGIYKGEEYTDNLLIEGDNLESLTYLKNEGRQVEVIYIDPPYNSLNADGTFIYKDRRLNKGDSYRHSSWLSFMEKRLKIARELLTEDGVIFISIDDRELYNLKLLCDEVFGESNFMSNLIWKKSSAVKNDKKNAISIQTEYVLMYSKNKDKVVLKNRELDPDYIKKAYRLEDERGKFATIQLYRNRDKGRNEYEIESPSGKKWKKPWMHTKENMERMIREGKIYWGKDGKSQPRKKVYLKDSKGRGNVSILDKGAGDNSTSKMELNNIFNGEVDFSYPKPTLLIKALLRMIDKEGITILDFFAGSGTTGHAVLELNKEDGGNRNFILCTNNENNICRDVTYQRLNKVINGYTTPKGKEVEGVPANLKYYKTELVDKEDKE